jgi:hypothetical protein
LQIKAKQAKSTEAKFTGMDRINRIKFRIRGYGFFALDILYILNIPVDGFLVYPP